MTLPPMGATGGFWATSPPDRKLETLREWCTMLANKLQEQESTIARLTSRIQALERQG